MEQKRHHDIPSALHAMRLINIMLSTSVMVCSAAALGESESISTGKPAS